jgi:pimeloyl-ACP methyl ester carboxylesterase
MWLALFHPEAVTRLIVADMAPVRYQSEFHRYVQAMVGLPLVPGLTRAAADAALADAVPEPAVRAFLLLNLLFPADRSGSPRWQLGLAEIEAAIDGLIDWPDPGAARYDGPTLFVAGERSNYVRPEHWPLIRALFPGAEIITLTGAGHWLHADNPAGFVAIVTEFLTVSPRGSSASDT